MDLLTDADRTSGPGEITLRLPAYPYAGLRPSPSRPAAPVAPLERLVTIADYTGRHNVETGRLTVDAIRARRIAEATTALPEIRPVRLLLRALRLRLTGGTR